MPIMSILRILRRLFEEHALPDPETVMAEEDCYREEAETILR